jgi:hypothetical protein
MGTQEEAAWREQRRHAVASHAAAQENRRATEAARGRELVAEFAREATARGLRTTGLTARPYGGGARYRTGLRGWYLQPDHRLAVGTDGRFYILDVPASLVACFTGVTVQPSDPRLIIGEGARDGESVPLEKLLRRRLDDGGL